MSDKTIKMTRSRYDELALAEATLDKTEPHRVALVGALDALRGDLARTPVVDMPTDELLPALAVAYKDGARFAKALAVLRSGLLRADDPVGGLAGEEMCSRVLEGYLEDKDLRALADAVQHYSVQQPTGALVEERMARVHGDPPEVLEGWGPGLVIEGANDVECSIAQDLAEAVNERHGPGFAEAHDRRDDPPEWLARLAEVAHDLGLDVEARVIVEKLAAEGRRDSGGPASPLLSMAGDLAEAAGARRWGDVIGPALLLASQRPDIAGALGLAVEAIGEHALTGEWTVRAGHPGGLNVTLETSAGDGHRSPPYLAVFMRETLIHRFDSGDVEF